MSRHPASPQLSRRAVAVGMAAAASLTAAGALRSQVRRPPLVIARGGVVGGWPAGSRGAYDQAGADGADFLETGLVPTKDGTLLARQDDELSADTNIAVRSEFADRRTTRVIDGDTREGWFCEDFTLAEIKSLALLLPGGQDRRPAGARSETPAILTFQELMAVARAASVRAARVVGVYGTLLHPRYFAALGLQVEAAAAQTIRAQGYNYAASAMILATDDAESLKTLAGLTRARRVRRWRKAPAGGFTADDFRLLGHGLAGVALPADLLLDVAKPRALAVSGLIDQAHAAGLAVHAWAGGPDAVFPPPPLKPGDSRRAMAALFAGGVDGLCAETASVVARARGDAFPDRDG